MKQINWLISSFDNHSSGASSKKLTAFALVVCVLLAHISWLKNSHAHNDYSLLTTILTIDFAFISTLFGINIADKKLNGNSSVTTTAEVVKDENSIKTETKTDVNTSEVKQ